MRKTIPFILLLLIIAGCTPTKEITSFKDPAYQDAVIHNVLVHIVEADLETRFKIEEELVSLLKKEGVSAIESYKLFPPTRDLSEDVMRDSILSRNIDSYLVSGFYNPAVEEVLLPATGTNNRTKDTGINNSGKIIESPMKNIYTRILDSETGNTIWIANLNSSGTSFINLSDWFCKTIINKLRADKLFPRFFDVIYLKNNTTMMGKIIEQNSKEVLIKQVGGTKEWVASSDITKIVKATDNLSK